MPSSGCWKHRCRTNRGRCRRRSLRRAFGVVVLPTSQAMRGANAAAIAAGEDLDHAADRVGAVQARTRAAHDLDAVDHVDRQVLERRQAGGRRADADAVDQHQHVVGFGAAHEQRGQLARRRPGWRRDAGAAAQQVGQRARLAAFDLLAVDHLHRRQRVIDGDGGAVGGDDDLVEVGGARPCTCACAKADDGERAARRPGRTIGERSDIRDSPTRGPRAVSVDREGVARRRERPRCGAQQRRRRRRDALRIATSGAWTRVRGRSPDSRVEVVCPPAAAPSRAMHSGGCAGLTRLPLRGQCRNGRACGWNVTGFPFQPVRQDAAGSPRSAAQCTRFEGTVQRANRHGRDPIACRSRYGGIVRKPPSRRQDQS